MMPIVAIDLDNVIAQTDSKIRQIIESISNVSLTQPDIQTWDYADALVTKGLGRSMANEIVAESLNRFHDADCLHVEALEGAIENILELHGAGLEIVIVTSRPENCESHTRRWLRESSVPDSWLRMERDKAAVCKTWSLLIEDAPHHAKAVAEQGTPVLLFDYPWNRTVTDHPFIKRVGSWHEVATIVPTTTHSRRRLTDGFA